MQITPVVEADLHLEYSEGLGFYISGNLRQSYFVVRCSSNTQQSSSKLFHLFIQYRQAPLSNTSSHTMRSQNRYFPKGRSTFPIPSFMPRQPPAKPTQNRKEQGTRERTFNQLCLARHRPYGPTVPSSHRGVGKAGYDSRQRRCIS